MAFDLDDEENKATRIANGASKERKDENMDIEVGGYVRTRAGHFYKITRIDENGLIYWNKIQCGWSMEQLKDIVVKHSKQLIDLIEFGDYVNGKYVKEIKGYGNGKSILALIGIIEEQGIKTIVTHEQMQSIEYKVEENK